MRIKRFFSAYFWLSLSIIFLLLLAACGGSTDEAVQDTGETDTGAVDSGAESEEIADDNPSATGSEADSGELPPTPETGSKVNATRTATDLLAVVDTAVITTTPPTNRIDSGETVPATPIDLVLLIDATGSMRAELDQLKAGLDDIAANLAALPGNLTLRYGFVIYRDGEKVDSTQIFGLTENWGLFVQSLMTVTAVGGGDYPEDLNGGFYHSVTSMDWNPTAIKLLVLLGDAPPHLADAETPTYDETLTQAASRNITIFTIGSDGLNEQGTAIYQQIAQAGHGRFIILTDHPDDGQNTATNVYPTAELPALLVTIVLEVLSPPSP